MAVTQAHHRIVDLLCLVRRLKHSVRILTVDNEIFEPTALSMSDHLTLALVKDIVEAVLFDKLLHGAASLLQDLTSLVQLVLVLLQLLIARDLLGTVVILCLEVAPVAHLVQVVLERVSPL